MHHSNLTWRFAVLWSVLALLLLVAAGPPDPDDPNSTQPRHTPVIAAWLRPIRSLPGPLEVLIAPRINAYNEISAFSYTVERDGSLTANDPVSDAVLVDFARLNGIRVIPTVASTLESSNVLRILRDPVLRAKHIEAIMQVARSPLIDGIDIDYENLPPEARQSFTDFITALAYALHREGKILSVTVPAKTRVDDPCVLCRFADYAALGRVADQIRVMAYEYHGKSGAPGPNAPIWWMRQVTEYAVSQVPRDRVILGVHLYGYDWGGKETTALWWSEVQALKERYRGQIRYVESDERGLVGESEMTYTIPGRRCPLYKEECALTRPEDHTIWFVDVHYVALTWDIVKEFKLGGIVLWRPGGEDPAIWDVINPVPNSTTN